MTIYEAIFVRKSIRKYIMEEISDEVLASIYSAYSEIQDLFMGIDTELVIIDRLHEKKSVAGLAVKAPYYLALYSEEKDKCVMNAGYIMEQLSLFLCSKGLGSCFMGSPFVNKGYRSKGDKKLICIMAFGIPKGSASRNTADFKRLEFDQLCVYREQPGPWIMQILESARLAPSAMNTQPWRFVIHNNKIHVFSKKAGMVSSTHMTELNFGILFSHMMVTAEEYWLDLDLIRLENISQKNFKNCEYVLSAVLNEDKHSPASGMRH